MRYRHSAASAIISFPVGPSLLPPSSRGPVAAAISSPAGFRLQREPWLIAEQLIRIVKVSDNRQQLTHV